MECNCLQNKDIKKCCCSTSNSEDSVKIPFRTLRFQPMWLKYRISENPLFFEYVTNHNSQNCNGAEKCMRDRSIISGQGNRHVQ